MTVQEIVEKLQASGNSITFYVRKDGGILVTSINGRKFTGAEGNRVARFMVGATLSEKRSSQLESIRPKRKAVLSKKIIAKIRKVQTKWKKNVDPSKGKITTKKVRWNIENLGEEEAMRKLGEAEKYATGIAYRANLDRFIEYINHYINTNITLSNSDKEKLFELIDWINSHEYQIKEDGIQPAYDSFYDYVEKATTEEELIIGIQKVKTCLLGQ